jgi:hypothetical protein
MKTKSQMEIEKPVKTQYKKNKNPESPFQKQQH